MRINLFLPIIALCLSLSANALDRHLQDALAAFQKKDFKSTIRNLKKVPKKERDENYWFVAGNAYFLMSKYKSALKAYQKTFDSRGTVRTKATEYAIRSARSAKLFEDASKVAKFAKTKKITSDGIDRETQALIDDVTINATSLYESKSFEKALDKIKLVSELGSSDPLLLVEGMSLTALGRDRRARKKLEEAQKSNDERIKARATELIHQLDRNPSTPSYTQYLYGKLGFGFDNNVLQDGQSEPKQKRALAEAQFGLTSRVAGDNDTSLYLRYSFFHSEPIGLALYRYLTQSLYTLGQFNLVGLQIQPSLGIEADLLGSDFILLTPAAGLSVGIPIAKKIQIALKYSFRKIYSLDSLFDYQEGNNHYVTAEISYFSKRIYIAGFVDYLIDNSQDLQLNNELLPTRFRGVGPGFYFLWFVSKKWQLSLTYSYLYKTFENTSADERIDNRYRTEFEARYKIGPRFSIYSNTRFIRNVSSFGSTNADDKNYSQVISVLGIMWESFK